MLIPGPTHWISHGWPLKKMSLSTSVSFSPIVATPVVMPRCA